MITSVRDSNIDQSFPAAAEDGYELTSVDTPDYNCIAWAASITNVNWWPLDPKAQGVDWPDGVPTEETLAAVMSAYGTLRYEDCGQNGSLQRGYEKIALYVNEKGVPTHAARQLSDGIWTSKLGLYKDIHHSTPRAIQDLPSGRAPGLSNYGKVAVYMRRRRMRGDICLRKPGVADLAPTYEGFALLKAIRWLLIGQSISFDGLNGQMFRSSRWLVS